jgi:hypothetical protein
MILDAGALIAVSRDERRMIARLLAAYEAGEGLRTHPLVLAQAWRDGRRQASLARFLRSVDVEVLDEMVGRRTGELLAKSKTADPIDAALVVIAQDGEAIVTSDPDDLGHLVRAARRRLLVVSC